jgi:hypothetical protein
MRRLLISDYFRHVTKKLLRYVALLAQGRRKARSALPAAAAKYVRPACLWCVGHGTAIEAAADV